MARLVGLARRAGQVVVGVRLTRDAVRDERAAAILVADDLATRRRDRWIARWREAGVPVYAGWSKDELGELTGRPAVAALTVTDRNIAAGLRELVEPPRESRRRTDREEDEERSR